MSEKLELDPKDLDNAYNNATSQETKDTLKRLYPEHFKKKGRAENGEKYWYISAQGNLSWDIEKYWEDDNLRFNFGNYFHTKKQAEMVLNGFDKKTQLGCVQFKGLGEFFRTRQRHFGIID